MPKYYIENGKCGTECVFKIIGSKWKPYIIHFCCEGTNMTYSKLKKMLGGIADPVLSRKLNELLGDGILERVEVTDMKSEFVLTSKAQKLLPVMEMMQSFAKSCGYKDSEHESAVEYASRLIGSKWKSRIIWTIFNYKTVRFNELQKSIEGISHKILKEQLSSLTEFGLVIRKDYYEKRPKVEYHLTEKGKEAYRIIKEISDWCIEYRLIKPEVIIKY